MRKPCIFITAFLLFLSAAAFAAAPEPVETIRRPIEEGLALVNDPAYHSPEKQETLREKIWDLVKDVFDFRAISMRALGRNWRDFDESQQERFTEAFTELLKNTYLDKVKGEKRQEKVDFIDQEIITGNRAVVRTILHSGDTEIPIDYSMLLRDDRWRIYDVNIEGVGMVKNYRTQFAEILSKESPDALIQRVKEKNIDHRKDRTDDGGTSDGAS